MTGKIEQGGMYPCQDEREGGTIDSRFTYEADADYGAPGHRIDGSGRRLSDQLSQPVLLE